MKNESRPLALSRCGFNSKSLFCVTFPTKRLIAARSFGDDFHPIGHQEGAVKADSKLPNQASVRVLGFGGCLQLFSKLFGTGSGAGPQLVNEILLTHPDAIVDDGESVRFLIRYDLDLELYVLVEQTFVTQR